MNIDWSKAPEGATHWNPENEYFYRFGEVSECWSDDGIGWSPACGNSPQEYEALNWVIRPPVSDAEQTRQEIITLAAKQCGLSGDSIRQLATVLAAEGYRKFEIVEEDV
jgi:hypothetical protein